MNKIDTTVFQHKEELVFFLLHHLSSLETSHVEVAGELKNKVVKYVRKEVEPKNVIFEDVYFVKHSHNEKTFMPGYINKHGKGLLVFMIQISDFESKYSIDNEILTLSKGNGLILLPENQECKVIMPEDINVKLDLLFFIFSTDNKSQGDII
jgi:hypothetical protein